MANQETETLKILQKIDDFADYAYPVFKQFPKSERYGIVADMKKSIDTMTHHAIEAEKKYYKKTTLQELDVEIAYMRILVKRSYRRKFLPEKKKNMMLDYLSEIGRMLGGWMKTCASREARRK
jgi:four helix bundle protein